MQPSSRDMAGGGGDGGGGGGDGPQDDFFDQMLSTLPSAWADLGGGAVAGKSPWELPAGAEDGPAAAAQAFDESTLLASRLRQHQIGGGGDGPVMLQLSDLHRQGGIAPSAVGEEDGSGAFPPLPLFTDRTNMPARDEMEGDFKSPNAAGGDHALFNGFGVHGAAATPPPFGPGGSMSAQSFGGPAASGGTAPLSSSGGGAAAPPRQQRVRARRGQATDPHSIAERLRRERIAERMKSLQELVPNGNKTDKASMLDEIIDYVKFLQLQVKVLSMSRLGGAAGMAPLVASMASEGNGNGSSNGGESGGGGGGGLRVTEQQVAKMMEEDMGTAMQYLQGKGLCLMPISLASAISSATSSASLLSRPPAIRPVGAQMHDAAAAGPTSPAAPASNDTTAAASATGNNSQDGGAGGKQ
ncbi:hypothetical protein GUJ93_ZPchr0012g19468 [Zizania palustris]|uniref:BHLH domain-containing protein n=1 Tax=Zizania palustris TaxID=103762 RepID=A0A8J6BXR1_ZIZPA|nr:hypothetical protein GUJ93_ZPchr0012g19468 [Zizania palustris]